MRTLLPAILVCLAMATVLGGRMIAAAAAPGGGGTRPAAPPPSFPPAIPRKPAPMATAPVDNDAPARHLRRRACLKDAKSKRLVGEQRNAYVKDCMGPG